jgi:hypothetical protein
MQIYEDSLHASTFASFQSSPMKTHTPNSNTSKWDVETLLFQKALLVISRFGKSLSGNASSISLHKEINNTLACSVLHAEESKKVA